MEEGGKAVLVLLRNAEIKGAPQIPVGKIGLKFLKISLTHNPPFCIFKPPQISSYESNSVDCGFFG
jgi:hypothetical protein